MHSLPARSICVSPYHKGPRWLLACYFYESRTRNRLQSYCITCVKIGHRKENLSSHAKKYKRDYSRKYKEKQRRAKGIPKRASQLKSPQFDPQTLYVELERWITKERIPVDGGKKRSSVVVEYLNGIRLDDEDMRYLSHLRRGTLKSPPLARVDILATKYDLPLWELIEAAGRYKRDIRTKRSERAKRKTDCSGPE